MSLLQPLNIANRNYVEVCGRASISCQPVCSGSHIRRSFCARFRPHLRNFRWLTGGKYRTVLRRHVSRELGIITVIPFPRRDLEQAKIADLAQISDIGIPHRPCDTRGAASTSARPLPAVWISSRHARLTRAVFALKRRIDADWISAWQEKARSIRTYPAMRIWPHPSLLLMACVSILACGHAK